ncbi:hypothetical protein FTO74_13790 [Granulicella sp. WH15]|uniref:hypothetical protein n=1 Tax=Granulicella sp. WH15 TaxID=2602070 RepID=UPI00136713B5|nr:hypothetical protein [Granulicella sp. WH15]QHN04314.1 hypothetical protein FTO74_13790 [Granulicella sp. WH15]
MTIPTISRRTFIQALAAIAATSRGDASPDTRHAKPFRVKDILHLPRSINFGLAADGAPLTTGSLYRDLTQDASELSFDVSNNQIAASLTARGEVHRACICCGVEALPLEQIKGGVYSRKLLLYGGPWSMQAHVESGGISSSHVKVALLENLLPLFTSRQGDVSIHQLVFAPVDRSDSARSPRALLNLTLLTNDGTITRQVSLAPISASLINTPRSGDPHSIDSSLSQNEQATGEKKSRALARCALFDHLGHSGQFDFDGVSLTIAPHASTVLATAWILGEDEQETDATLARLNALSLARWLEDTLDVRRIGYGTLSIPRDSFVAESVIRFAELSRQSALRSRDGRFCGGFLGSDVGITQVNWARDAYYSMLAMSLFDPALCADSIPYFLKWGCPTETTGPARSRFPGAGSISQSLSNSVSGLSLAGAYYRSTGDRSFFIARPEILEQARRIFDEVLASRRGTPMLFPSLYFSDGEARGEYHTGSNVAAWFAFMGMAQVAAEAYGDDTLAHEWSSVAQSIHDAISTYCVGKGPDGDRFFEGVNKDGSFVQGHDGEESETTLLPFYGFCKADDPRLLHHASLAMTKENPLYSPELDAIWWYNANWSSATFPGWTTALAGAADEPQILHRLNRIRSLTDLDGSPWWWPYTYGSKDPSMPLRGDVARKCGWGAAVYLCCLINNFIGVSVDARSRSIHFAPFIPWDSFSWNRARIGATSFDLELTKTPGEISAFVRNRNCHRYAATIVLTPGKGISLKDLQASGVSIKALSTLECWGRTSLQVEVDLAPGEHVHVRAKIG